MRDDLRPTEQPTFDAHALAGQRVDANGTIHPPQAERSSGAADPTGDLILGPLLGEGGMGVVHAATQPDLLREVAVKRTKDAALEPSLFLEARIAGSLEHPNVVPVYGVRRGDDGRLELVMRRIGGTRWSGLIAEAEAARDAARGQDPLGFHIGVLMQVCDAVALAHSRGILHRDLKPDNVMVGTFGEVYVLDWGIAVALKDDERGLPLASRSHRIAGTPAYMAPEQALGRGDWLGPATDVYLLGAILVEVLTGQPPHRADTPFRQLDLAATAEAPALGPPTPPGLAAIVSRALQWHPQDRYQSVTELRSALRSWLDARSAEQLTAESAARVERLTSLLRLAFDGERVDPREVSALLTEARFGFRQALTVTPGSEPAIAGLQRAGELGIRYEVFRLNVDGARSLLAELPHPRPDLAREVEELVADLSREDRDVKRLRRLREDLDPGSGGRTRAAAGLLVGVVVGLLCVGLGAFDRLVSPIGYGPVLAGVLVFDLLIAIALLVWSLVPGLNLANQRLRRVMATLALAISLHWAGAWWIGLELSVAVAMNALLSATTLLVMAWQSDRAMFPSAGVYAAAWALALGVPELALVTFGIATGVAFGLYSGLATMTAGRRRA